MNIQQRRIVLQDSVSLRDFEGMAFQADWFFEDKVERSEHTPFEVIWMLGDGSGSVHYIEDFLLHTTYILIRSLDPDSVSQLIHNKLPVIERQEILEQFYKARSTIELIAAMYRIAAITQPTFDQALFEAIISGLSHENANLRKAAILACGYAEWPELGVPLRKVRDTDSDIAVRADAQGILQGLEHLWSDQD